MKRKILTTLVITVILIFTIGTASAGFFDFLGGGDDAQEEAEALTAEDVLINSTATAKYADNVKSDEYAWYTSDGEYAGAAYYEPWNLNATINIDIEKMYEYLKDGSSYQVQLEDYTLDDFKEDLIKSNEEHPVVEVLGCGVNSDDGGVADADFGDTTCHIDEKNNILTVNYYYSYDQYSDAPGGSAEVDYLKNGTDCSYEIEWDFDTSVYLSQSEGLNNEDADKISCNGHTYYYNQPITIKEM